MTSKKMLGNQKEEPQFGYSLHMGEGSYEVQPCLPERFRSFGICGILLAFLLCSAGISPACSSEVNVGVCWGRNSWQSLRPQTVVQLLQDNGIKKLKLFGADPDIMGALVGTDIEITDIAQFLHQTGSSFSVNIYPFLTVYQQPRTSSIPLSFVMKMSSIPTINGKAVPGAFQDPGNKLYYSNIFDGAYDAMVTVLANLGYPDVEVTIGEIGWPSDGQGDYRGYASPDLAEIFNNYIIRHFSSGRGTPQRPNNTIHGYLFSLLDENNKSTGAGSFERHWGIFTADGTPKYPLDLTGSGHPKDLVPAKNVSWLPKRWCVASKNATLEALSAALGFACGAQASDCTPTVAGGTCYFNGDLRNISSYSFNSYFQLHKQDSSSCNFGGSAIITSEDPSSGNCTFPIGMITPSKGCCSRYVSLLVQVLAVLWVFLQVSL